MEQSFNMVYLGWALFLGGLSAISLPLGSIFGILVKPKSTFTSIMAAFGAGALIAALTIELVAPTIQEFVHSSASGNEAGHGGGLAFFTLMAGLVVGGALFIFLDQAVSAHGGFLRKTATTIAFFSQRKKVRARKILEELGKIELLRKVPDQHVQRLVDCVRPAQFNSSEIIFSEGDDGDRLYFIESGKIDIIYAGEKIKTLEAGDVVGEIALLTEAPRNATAKANGTVQSLILLKDDFDLLRKEVPELDEAARALAASRLDENKVRSQDKHSAAHDWADGAVSALQTGTMIPTPLQIQSVKAEHSGAPLAIWLGILLDGIPESFVIGAGFLGLLTQRLAESGAVSLTDVIPYTLIAGLFLSNFPEAMSSSVGMRAQGMPVKKILIMWSTLVVITALGAGLGYLAGESLPHDWVVFIEGVAAGAMLTMITAAMVPEAVHLGGGNIAGFSTLIGFISAIAFKLFE